MLSDKDTISLIQNPEINSSTLSYHMLQHGIERTQPSPASLIAKAGSAVIGDPVGAPEALNSIVCAAEENHGVQSFFHVSDRTAHILQNRGYRVAQLGIETVIPLPFSLSGANKSDLRRARNRALGAKVRVIEISSADFPAIADNISRLNDEWLDSRRVFRSEFRLLARPFNKDYQSGERRFIALQDDRILGLAVYDPFFDSGAINGYFEAIVRQYDNRVPGVRDILTLVAMNQFSSEGVQKLSLGLSPFVRNTSDHKLSLSDSALALFSRFGGGVFNCRGLAFHKSRYRGFEVPIFYATKNPLPLLALYRICVASNIDPLKGITSLISTKLTRFRQRLVQNLRASPLQKNPTYFVVDTKRTH